MTHEEITQLLVDAGFTSGWAISDNKLIIWQHDEDPPTPLVRPE